MRFYLGLSISDISHQLGFGESKIKVSIHRTRKKIAELMQKEGIIV
jgi:DNA-directed RNA polymerase specialized sigma24 family protein